MCFLVSGQIPGTFNELEDPEIQPFGGKAYKRELRKRQEVLEKFGDVLACTSTVLQAAFREARSALWQVIFGSHDIGDLMIKIFRSGGSGRDQITMFVGSAWTPRAFKSL